MTDQTPAERLLDAAGMLRRAHGIVVAEDGLSPRHLAMMALGLKLLDRPALAFQAVLEGWDEQRIVREIY